jgi:hypothetical protein
VPPVSSAAVTNRSLKYPFVESCLEIHVVGSLVRTCDKGITETNNCTIKGRAFQVQAMPCHPHDHKKMKKHLKPKKIQQS